LGDLADQYVENVGLSGFFRIEPTGDYTNRYSGFEDREGHQYPIQPREQSSYVLLLLFGNNDIMQDFSLLFKPLAPAAGSFAFILSLIFFRDFFQQLFIILIDFKLHLVYSK
jgi:hypothetical protein